MTTGTGSRLRQLGDEVRELEARLRLGGGQDGAECYAGRLVYTPQESMH